MVTNLPARNSGSAPASTGALAVLNNYPKDKYNVLAPVSMETISPYHAVRTYACELSADPNGGDVFKTGSIKKGDSWVDTFGLSKVALFKLADLAGVRWNPRECKRLDNMTNPLYVSWQVEGGIRRSDGSWYWVRASKELDLEVIREEIKGEQTKKAARDKDAPREPTELEAYIEKKTQAEWIQRRKHKAALCETGAYNRALRMLLKVKSQYTLEELRRPFIVTQIALNPESDPAIRAAMRVRVEQDYADLGFAEQAPPREAIEGARHVLALASPEPDAAGDDDPGEGAEVVDVVDEETDPGFDESDRPDADGEESGQAELFSGADSEDTIARQLREEITKRLVKKGRSLPEWLTWFKKSAKVDFAEASVDMLQVTLEGLKDPAAGSR